MSTTLEMRSLETIMRTGQQRLYGGIEAGGTKFVCALGTRPAQPFARAEFKTTTPEETMAKVLEYFTAMSKLHGPLSSLGIGCFGPVSIKSKNDNFGQILQTTKTAWSGYNIVEKLKSELDVPVNIQTDVNAALIAESKFGAGRGFSNVIYVTIGTGIGAGVMIDKKVIVGTGHPEIGHIFLPKELDDTYNGVCVFHGDLCAEGLASGPALAARWGKPGVELGSGHAAWDLEARYISSLCVSLILSFGPEKIILGGGVMTNHAVLDKIRGYVQARLNGYASHLATLMTLPSMIVPPNLKNDAGVIGALILAQEAHIGKLHE